MAEYRDRERFIPYRKTELVEMLCQKGKVARDSFRLFCKTLGNLYHYEFHEKLEDLCDNYLPFYFGGDTRGVVRYSPDELNQRKDRLIKKFKEVLNDANYQEIERADLQYAMERESIFKISLYINFDDFDQILLFWRGNNVNKAVVKRWFRKKIIDVPTFERVAMLVKFKDAEHFDEKRRKQLSFAPGTMLIKLFRNIPKADLEMLFPNTRVRMRLTDKIKLFTTGIVGGIGLIGKGAPIVAAFPIIWIVFRTLITGKNPNTIDSQQMALLIAAGSALGAVFGYAWKQWDKYRNRKIQFTKTLAENLYFKNLDNDTGVFYHLINAAEEEECKEAILGYYFLLTSENGLSKAQLDDKIENWLEREYGAAIDFEISDALRKLMELELICAQGKENEKIYQVLPLDQSCEKLKQLWSHVG